jgi:MFS family permease
MAEWPRWYYGWNIIGAGMTFQAVLFGLTFFSFIFWAPIWAVEFATDLSDVMWANVGMMVAQGLISPFVGHAMDRLSIKWLVTCGALVAAVGFVIAAQATEVWHLIAVYSTLIPLGVLLAGPLAAQTLAAKWFAARRGLAIGISTTGTSIGGFLFPIVAGLLFAQYGWRTTHLLLAGVIVATVIPVVWLIVANQPADKGVQPEGDGQGTDGAATRHTFPVWSTVSILRERNFWVIILAFVPLMTAQGAVQANLAAFAIDLGTARELTPRLISLMAVTMIGGKLFFGRQADHWDHRYLFLLAVGLIALVMLLMLATPGYAMQLLIAALLGIGTGAFLPLLGAIISSRFGAAGFGKVMGLLGPFMTASALGTVFAANIYDATGAYDLALKILLVGIIPAGLIMLLLQPKPGDESAVTKEVQHVA